jgi:transcriptional regulator with PAS, ATPase and Fis domain
LSDLVARGFFRQDLYYRLGGVEIHVPPLRGRQDDVIELARYFLSRHQHTRELRLSPMAEAALCAYDWPGNVRELERLIERAVALVESDSIELDDLPPRVRGEYAEVIAPSLAGDDTFRAWGSRYVRLVLARVGGNKSRACRALGISYHTLRSYLRYPERYARYTRKRDAVAYGPLPNAGHADQRP